MDSQAALTDFVNLFSKTSTFISIDVVESTALKSGENDQDVIYTFLSFHKMIRELSYTHHGEIITISGDGVMCRFERADDAAAATVALLNDLPAFNKRQNRLSRSFALRIGLNTGQVYESQSLTPGHIISHTIDVAAKLQQACHPNQALFSQETVNAMQQMKLSLARIGWDAQLKTTAYQYTGTTETRAIARVMPNPVRVLVVEDDLTELLKLRKILWSRRHDPFLVFNSAQAALCATAWKPHVILVSADLPWNAGWELLKSIRSEQSLSRTPVVVLSAQVSGGAVEQCFELGANGYLNKPMEELQVGKRMDAVLREFYL